MNVYNYIDMNYLHEPELENLLPKDLVTDFLQKQAWQGLDDEELRIIWRDIYAYVLANLQTGQTVFQNRNLAAVKNIVAWLKQYALDFTVTPASLRRFLNNVQLLHDYLIKEKYILHSYLDFPATFDEFIGKDGKINITNPDEKVLHIDFGGKRLQTSNFEPTSMVSTKQLIYIREHIIDFSAKVFDVLSYYRYTLTSEKLFSFYELYWNRFVEAKVDESGDSYDADDLEQFLLTTPNNILTFAEYIAFGAEFAQGREQIYNKLVTKNKAHPGFVSFLKHYHHSRIMFFRIVDSSDEQGTLVKDVLTGDSFYLEDIDISRYNNREVFIAYFSKSNNLLPSVTISVELDEMQVLAFQDAIKKMCRYFLGTEASVKEFLEKYGLLARYLCVLTARNKRIGIMLKELLQKYDQAEPAMCSMNPDADILEEKVMKIPNDFYFTVEEKEKFLKIWRSIYAHLGYSMEFSEHAGNYLLANLKIFLELNYPEDMVDGLMEVFETDKDTLQGYIDKVHQVVDIEKYKLSYLTEFGMIKLIDSLINKE